MRKVGSSVSKSLLCLAQRKDVVTQVTPLFVTEARCSYASRILKANVIAPVPAFLIFAGVPFGTFLVGGVLNPTLHHNSCKKNLYLYTCLLGWNKNMVIQGVMDCHIVGFCQMWH